MGYTKNRNFYKVPNPQIFAPGAALWWFFVKFKKRAKLLLSSLPLSSLKNWAKLLLSSLPVSPSRVLRAPAHHRTIWCRSTFGPRGPGLSNPTSFLRPALPMAPTTDNNARDKRSVPRPNPAMSSLKNWAKLLLSSLPVSSLKNWAKLLLSSLPVSPSRVLRAPGTSSYHLVPKHLRATWPRPEQSHLLPEACSTPETNGASPARTQQHS